MYCGRCIARSAANGVETLSKFPRPLLDDLVAGRWLPILGAGFSRNAVLPTNQKMPLWNDLGELLKADLPEYELCSALDAFPLMNMNSVGPS